MNLTEEQKLAISKDNTNIIVSAGAGSGKTFVLTERVIDKIKKGINIDELLILTFTEAASKEMKERITKKMTDNELYNQLDKVGNSYITTFDSFALSLVKKYSHILNIDRNLKIADESIMKIKKTTELDKIFEELYDSNDEAFLNFIDDFCIKDDTDIKNCILNIFDKINMKYTFDFDNYIENNYSEKKVNENISKYMEYIYENIEQLKLLCDEVKIYATGDYYEKVYTEISKYDNCKDFNEIKNVIIDIPRLPNKNSNELKTVKDKLTNIYSDIKELTNYENVDEIKNQIYSTKNNACVVIKIIKRLNEKINKYKFENDLYEFVDIAKLAIKIVKENEEIKNELKYKFKEIMIDEYQDTNDLQDIFISEIENNNVYMVGDIKQSIYRFRNANPDLFKQKYGKYAKNDGGIKIDLNKNFRSRNEVILAINKIFDGIMDDNLGGAEYSISHRMQFGNTLYEEYKKKQKYGLEIYNYEKNNYKKEEIEAFIIANDIKEKINSKYQVLDKDAKVLRDLKYSDIAILMDKSTNFELYKKIFNYLNVPISIYKEKTITNSEDILIIKNILALLLNDEECFKHAFMSIERSYLFDTNDDVIFDYLKNNNYDESESMKKINQIKITTLKKTIEDLIYKFDFYEKMIIIGDIKEHIDTIEYIMDKAEELEQLGYSVNDFYNHLNDILNQNIKIDAKVEKDKNGVKIVTIHKSKGLEYYICYYSGLYSKFNHKELNESILYDNEFGIIMPYVQDYIRPIIYKTLLKQKYLKEELSEKIRLFYVALTRAREKMILVCPYDENDMIFNGKIPNYIRYNYKSFLDMFNSLKNRFETDTKMIDIEKLSISKKYNTFGKNKINIENSNKKLIVNELVFENEYVEKHKFSKNEKSLLTKKEYENILYGTKIHNIFENIDFKNPSFEGLNKFEEEKVKKFLNNSIFDNVIKTYKEYEFKYNSDNEEYHGIIDLLLEYTDHFAIVDYKLKNIDDEEYIKQISGYKEYIEKLTNKECEIYLYSIMDEKLKKM